MKYLVLGFATNQSSASFRVFINSLRQVYPSDQCDLVLIVDRVPADLDADGKAGVTFFHTPSSYPHGSTISRKLRSLLIRLGSAAANAGLPVLSPLAAKLLEPMIERWHHPHFGRWVAYQRYLRANPNYDGILLTDVRDVLFQDRFFEGARDIVELYEQDESYGTGNCDSDWYREAWGEEALRRADGRPAVCIGTILGSHDQIMKLIHDFIVYYSRAPFRGVEQAIFNRLLLEGQPTFAYRINRNIDGAVATLAGDKAHGAVSVSDRISRKSDGSTVPIVHMYDRFEDTDRVAQTYMS